MSTDNVIEIRDKFNRSEKEDEDIYQWLEKIPKRHRSYEFGRLVRQLFPLRDKLNEHVVEHT